MLTRLNAEDDQNMLSDNSSCQTLNKCRELTQTETSQLKEDTEGSLGPTVAENWITWFNSNSYFLHIEGPNDPIICLKNIELVITLSVKYNLLLFAVLFFDLHSLDNISLELLRIQLPTLGHPARCQH